MKKFECPEMTISVFEIEDVIAVSGGLENNDPNGTGWGD